MKLPAWLFAFCSCVLAITGCSGGDDPEKPRDKDPISFTSGNLKIHGLLSKPPGKGPFPLLFVNPASEMPASSMAWYIDRFTAKGFVTLALDFRGCGQSEGTFEFEKGEVDDVLNALEYAQKLPYVDSHRVGVLGVSAGAAIGLLAASRSPDIRAVVAIQGPIEQADCFRYWAKHREKPYHEARISLASVIVGMPDQVPNKWKIRSPLYVADRIKCPVLLIYGDRDDVVPADQGNRMEEALKKSGNRLTTLVMVEGASHGDTQHLWPKAEQTIDVFLMF